MEVFAKNLRQRAAALGLSNAEVARRLGLEERRYGNYVTGRREPDLATLLRISEVLGVSLDLLLSSNDAGAQNALDILRSRLATAATVLSEQELQSVVIQVEALAANTTSKQPPKAT